MNNLVNIRSFIKFLSKNKFYTAIDIFGLSISLMFVILIAVYTIKELSIDNYQEKADRIYVLSNGDNLGSAYRIADRIIERYPEIEKVCPTAGGWGKMPVFVSDTKMDAELFFADSTFFDLFSFQLLSGDRRQAMAARHYVVISESFARKVFTGRDPLGQSIKLNDELTVTVNGVMKDINNSLIPYCDILVRMDNIKYYNSSMDSEIFQNAGGAQIFILEKEGANLQAKADDMALYFKNDLKFWQYERGIYDKVMFIPMKEAYFSTIQGHGLNHGDWRFVMILMSVGILILLFAVINYINLTVAQTGFRAKEIATRRLLGSSREEAFSRLIMESTLLCFISFLIGLLFALAVVPFANSLLRTNILVSEILSPLNILIYLIVILILGLISGLLPAIIISNTKPIDVVRGSFRQKTKMVFSKFFITFQNVITIMLIAASITMLLQINHMIKAPLGYNTTNLIEIPGYQFESKERMLTFVNEINQLAGVNRTSLSQGTPFNRGNNMTTDYDGRSVSFQLLIGDETYFDMLGLQKIRENNLANDDGYYLTEQAVKETGIDEASPVFKLGKDRQAPVAGIINDIQLYNITYPLKPTLVQIKKIEDFYPWDILVETQGDHYTAYEQIKKIYEDIAMLDFEGEFIDQQIQKSFEAQRRTSTIVMIFCGIAILISLLGLLAMSTYFTQQRSREIAVRKVFGSSSAQMLSRLVWTFLNYVLIAFIIATPLIWYIMKQWLSDYSYRIELSPLIFIAAGLFCLLVSFISVFWQSRKAANANPVVTVKAD